MHIRYGYAISVVCDQPTSLIAMLDVNPAPHRAFIAHDVLEVTALVDGNPVDGLKAYRDSFGNICRRLVAPAGGVHLTASGVVRDSGEADAVSAGAAQVAPEALPDETLLYLLGSRYCETDRLGGLAWSRFGAIVGGWQKVQAVCDYVHELLRFDYGQARNTRTAAEAVTEGVGVCRDFAHLAITLCRCLNIPARYCTGYLGDIGVPRDPAPMDFSAWFEVYLEGGWWTFDARHNIPRIGRIVIARGRDATDVPIINTFGPHVLARFEVVTEEMNGTARLWEHMPVEVQTQQRISA